MENKNTAIERLIFTKASEPTIRDLCDRITKGKMLVTEFQRHYVWENRSDLKSRLIESVLLEIPIPVIYTAETDDGNEEVVDGQQRLFTFHGFINNHFKLKGLEILKDLNGKSYKDFLEMSPNLQSLVDNYPIRVVKILKESDPDVKFDIFERLNRGSVKLNEQELRNCVYRGEFNNLLKELVNDATFLRMQNLSRPHRRMVDAERILRFFAFCDKTERNYKSPLKTFLNSYMREKRPISEEEILKKIALFRKCVELCSIVFGKMAFKRWYPGWSQNENGHGDSTLNEGLTDIQLCCFMEYEKREIVPKSQAVKDAFIDLVCNPEFVETIEIGTYSTNMAKKRTNMWFSVLRDIMAYPEQDRRLYTYEEKVQLFSRENGDVCQICKNKIANIDDAHVDHIERFADGGKTVVKNAQLTHRYCNLAKG
jgi:hypothetical protein